MLGSVQRDTLQASKQQFNGILTEDSFTTALNLEIKRSDRTGHKVLLALLHVPREDRVPRKRNEFLKAASPAVRSCLRDTDLFGWYRQNSVLGIAFTDWQDQKGVDPKVVVDARLRSELELSVPADVLSRLLITYHSLPAEETGASVPPTEKRNRRVEQAAKRAMDIGLSLMVMPLLLPLFAVIGIIIKMNSKGPILYKQTRIGKSGRPFTFLKFRSMYDKNDPAIHREYVTRLILGQEAELAKADATDGNHNGNGHHKGNHSNGNGHSNGSGKKVFKIVQDPRVTSVGRILRKSSLDEVPQFINVLKGDMSLVGPRPPVVYEVERYKPWHHQRVRHMKPGITGLWQVSGRSRATFDEMVRLDLQYARSWSLWLDIKILLRTPAAVLSGEGAY
jgi:exopolysaccharide biosynthesis polyprenyl glycosylphosphotransferase